MAKCPGGVCSVPGNNMAIQGAPNGVMQPTVQRLGGTKDRLGSVITSPLYDQSQNNLLNQLAQLAQGQLNRAGGALGTGQGGQNNWQQYFNFAPIEQQARTQFNTQTIPSLAERFTAMGGEGGQRSSAFQGALGRAGSDLEQGLAALKAQYALPQAQLAQNQQQLGQNQQGINLNLLQTLLSGGLTRKFDLSHGAYQPSGWERFWGVGGGQAVTNLAAMGARAGLNYLAPGVGSAIF